MECRLKLLQDLGLYLIEFIFETTGTDEITKRWNVGSVLSAHPHLMQAKKK